MSTAQIIAIVFLFLGAIAVGVGAKFLPRKVTNIVIPCLVFVFSAFTLANAVHVFYNTAVSTHIFFVFFLVALVVTVFLVYRCVAEEEERRKIFLYISLVIFAIGMVAYIILMAVGFHEGVATFLPGHTCRQTCMGFPLVYFAREKVRKFILPYFCYSGILGGIMTMCTPENELTDWTMGKWTGFDTVIQHTLMLWIPIILFVTTFVKSNFIDIPMGALGWGSMILVAFICNAINFGQSGEWGNWLYLTTPIRPWFPAWLYLSLSYVLAVGLCLSMIGLRRFSKRWRPRQESNLY